MSALADSPPVAHEPIARPRARAARPPRLYLVCGATPDGRELPTLLRGGDRGGV